MRKRLMAAVAVAPLALFSLQPAFAQTTISSSQSNPVSTSSSGDITITSAGTQQQNAAGAAITIDSNNSVNNGGAIQSKDIDNVTGILVQSGSFTGTLTNGGGINLTESYSASDSVNADGIPEAPFAQGNTRFGIRTAGVLNGNIINSGQINVQGNISSGILISNGLNGSLVSTGAITVKGDQSTGIRTAGRITGSVQISGPVDVQGVNAVGVQTSGPIDGSLTIYTSVNATGYSISSRITGSTALQKVQATPTDVQQGGSALLVQNSVARGIYIAAPPAGTVASNTTTDADADGVVDSVEGTASLSSAGAAPALQIGSSAPITIGNFGTGANAYGLIISGSVSGAGVYDGVSATGIDIGVGGGGVNLNGGLNVNGQVGAAAYQADATAIRLENGVTGSALRNAGSISSNVTSASANTSTALLLDAGSNIASLTNFGNIIAAGTGNTVNASVIVDRSGKLATIVNTGNIVASLTAAKTGELVLGKGIALDLRANTSGITLTQQLNGTTKPSIVGDILLGNGPNTVNLLSGGISGGLSFGTGAGSFTIDNASTYIGNLTYGGKALAINVTNGTLQNNAASTINASSLTVGGSSSLIVALDPQNKSSTVYNVSGAANFAAGSKIGATLLSTPSTAQTFTVVKASSLTVGANGAALLTSLPFLFSGSISTNTGAGTISLTVATKSAADLLMNKAEASAFPAILAALPQDANIQTSIVSSQSRANFISTYDQLLPNSGGDVFQTALNMSKAISRATADRFDLTTQEDEEDFSTTGMWISEFYTGIEQAKAENNPFHSAGLGFVGGIDFGGYGGTFSLGSANITRPGSGGSDSQNSVSRIEGGFYLAPRFGLLSIDARLGGGYLVVKDRRQFIASILSGDLSTVTSVSRTATGSWNGYDLTGHLGAGMQFDLSSRLFVQPKIYADFFHTHEDAYTEAGGGSGFNLAVSGRDGTQTNATASLVTGMKFGKTFIFTPQLEVGYDSVIQGGAPNTTARFAYTGSPSFTVSPNAVGGAAMARFSLKGDGNYVHFSFQGGGEFRNGYHAIDLRAVFRMTY